MCKQLSQEFHENLQVKICGKDKLKFPNSSFFMMNVSERGNKLKSNGATVTSRL